MRDRNSPSKLPDHVSRITLRPQDLSRDDGALDFACTFANGAQLRIAPVFFSGIVLDVSVSAVDLNGLFGDANGTLTRIQLRHRRLLGSRLAGVLHRRGPIG